MIQNSLLSLAKPFAFSAVLALASVAGSANAAAPMQKTSAPGFYRMLLGDFEVTVLLDTNSPWPSIVSDLFPELNAEQVEAMQKLTKLQLPADFSTNTGKQLVLVDTGSGSSSQAEFSGHLLENMAAAGYKPEQVDEIYITHFHEDHVGGLSENGKRVFPNAIIRADQREIDGYTAAADKGRADAKRVMAKLAPYLANKQVKSFDGATRLIAGIRSIPAYGHSYGHSFYAVESQGKKLVLWGDFVVLDALQLGIPGLIPPGEADPKAGIAMRAKVFKEAEQQGYLIGAAHVSFPGLGRLRGDAKSYSWVSADYVRLP
jgi:glyoxylase-like metal-dependent hydrolase (beta-lactamase superfamily II)